MGAVAGGVVTIATMLHPFSALLIGGPALGIAAGSALLAKAAAEERDEIFQRELAGLMARRFVDKLKLKFGNTNVNADFTLEGDYRKGRRHRVHFSVTANELQAKGITRAYLEHISIKPTDANGFSLPNFSVANVTGGRIQFSTPTYRKSVSDTGVYDDLLQIRSGGNPEAGSSSAFLNFPPTSWEKENLRDSITKGIERLVQHLDSHLFHYHKAIWWNMDPDELFTILDGYTLSETDTRSIASVVEYGLLATVGNSLVFKVARGAFVGVNGLTSLNEAFDFYAPLERKSDPMRVSVPTAGLYAQSLMDECNACEEHYGSTDWVLEREKLTPQELDSALLASRRAAPQDLTPTDLPDTLINLQNVPAAPAPSGVQGGFDAVTSADSFRDMAGLAGTQANARAAMEAAKNLASEFGNLGAKQMDALRAARARVNTDPNLTSEDKAAITKPHEAKKPKPDQAEQAKSLIESGVTEAKITDSSSGGPVPTNERAIEIKTPSNDIQFASTGSGRATGRENSSANTFRDLAKDLGKKMGDILSEGIGDPDVDLKEALKDGLADFAKEKLEETAVAGIQKLPLGGMLLGGCKLSLAFAKGAGEKLIETNVELNATNDQLIREIGNSLDAGDGLTEADIKRLMRLRRWQLVAVQQLAPITIAGLNVLALKAATLGAGKLAKKITDDNTSLGQALSKHKQSLTSIAKLVTEEEGEIDDPVKTLMEKAAVGLTGIILKGIDEPDFRASIRQTISNVRNNPEVRLEILAGVADAYERIQSIVDTGIDPSGELLVAADLSRSKDLLDEVKNQLLIAGRKFLAEAVKENLAVSPGTAIEIDANGLTLPQAVINVFNEVNEIPTMEMFALFDAFDASRHALSDEDRFHALGIVHEIRSRQPSILERGALIDQLLKARKERATRAMTAFKNLLLRMREIVDRDPQFAHLSDDAKLKAFIDPRVSVKKWIFKRSEILDYERVTRIRVKAPADLNEALVRALIVDNPAIPI